MCHKKLVTPPLELVVGLRARGEVYLVLVGGAEGLWWGVLSARGQVY